MRCAPRPACQFDSVFSCHDLRLWYAQKALAEEYYDALETFKDISLSRQFAADMANQLWAGSIGRILMAFNDPLAMAKMGLGVGPGDLGADEDAECAAEICEIFGQLVIRTAAHRTWSMLTWCLPPEQWDGVLSQSEADAKSAFDILKRDADTVRKAQERMQSTRTRRFPMQLCAPPFVLSLLCRVCKPPWRTSGFTS